MLDGSLTAKTNRHNLCALVRTWHDVGHTPAAEGDRKHRKGGDDGWNQGRGTRAGVSVSTVSYVLSGKRAISEKTAAKVRDAIRELQYTPDASAQKMRGIRNRILLSASRFAATSTRRSTTRTSCTRHGRRGTQATTCCCSAARMRWTTSAV